MPRRGRVDPPARRDRHEVGVRSWHVALPEVIESPGDDRAIVLESEAVATARRDGHEIVPAGDVRLAVVIGVVAR